MENAVSRNGNGRRLFVFGLGYVAQRLATRLLAEGWKVAGTTRSAEKAATMKAQGIQAFLFDRGHHLADPKSALRGTTHLLITLPPDAEGDPALDHEDEHIADLQSLAWVGLLSTTGVYGDHQGGWVDETTPLNPSGPRGLRRVKQEQGWQKLAARAALPLHIFRLAGIYGPGRNALEEVARGTARRIDKPGQVFSRIHLDDIVGALRASIAKPEPGAIYNLADDLPASAAEVTDYACGLLGRQSLPLIPFEEAAKTMTPMALSFYADSRRVSNAKLKNELRYRLRYPNYQVGLKALK